MATRDEGESSVSDAVGDVVVGYVGEANADRAAYYDQSETDWETAFGQVYTEVVAANNEQALCVVSQDTQGKASPLCFWRRIGFDDSPMMARRNR
jgi:lipase chaperone LimK